MNDTIPTTAVEHAIAAVQQYFWDRSGDIVFDSEIDVLIDPTRVTEAIDIIDHWSDNMGLPGKLRGDLAEAVLDAANITG